MARWLITTGHVGGRKKARIPAPSNLTPPVVTGDVVVGQTLAAAPGVWDSKNPPIEITRRWEYSVTGSNGPWIPYAGETSLSLELLNDPGALTIFISHAETATDSAGGRPRVARSNVVGPLYGNQLSELSIQLRPGPFTLATEQGTTVADVAGWHPTTPGNGSSVAGTTALALNAARDRLVAAAGWPTAPGTISGNVVETNALMANSPQATPIPSINVTAAPIGPPVNTSLPVISGVYEVTQIIAATLGGWTGADSVYRVWQRSPDGLTDWQDVPLATTPTYLLEAVDETYHFRRRETGTNASGSVTAYSNPVGPIEASQALPRQLLRITERGHVGELAEPFVTPDILLDEPIPVVISRNGFDEFGAPTRTLFNTQARFKRYDRLTSTTHVQPPRDDQVSLDDNCVVGDVVSQIGLGQLTNDSEVVMPIARMQHVDNDHRVVGNSLTVGACGAALGAREQRFFAMVRHTLCVDGVPTETVDEVRDTVPHIYQTGLSVQSYNGVFDLSGVPDGTSVQVDTEGFPWYGDVSVASKRWSGVNDPEGNFVFPGGFRRQYFFKHAALAAARPIAYVDAVNGDNGTGVVGYANDESSQTAASAAPFATPAGAFTAIAAANNTNHGFSSVDGGIVRLKTDINSSQFVHGQNYHRGSSVTIEKDPESFPEGNATINLVSSMNGGTLTALGAAPYADAGTLQIYLSGISVARRGVFYLSGGQWVLVNGSAITIGEGGAPTNASRICQNSGLLYLGDGSTGGSGLNALLMGGNNTLANCMGVRGFTATGYIQIPDFLILGSRFTASVNPRDPWPQTTPDINGTRQATPYWEGSFFGKLGGLSTPLTRFAAKTPAQALVAVNVVLERSHTAQQNCFGISSDGASNSTLAGVLYYGVIQAGYNLAGRGNSFYADREVDVRLHPFPVYCQSIIARNAWKGAVEAGARDNPDHLDGAEWYGMGVGRKYNGYLWSNQFTRPVSEAREFGGKMRWLPVSDSGASYDPSLDFMDWKASTESYVATSGSNWTNDGNGDYRVKTTSIFHGIVEENFLKYDIEGNLRPATGDSPGPYVRMTE